ncbi:hypothetical protein C047_02354 [Brucella melitensis Uk24/06]|nr:hypothetical protein DK63_2520 [Brucella melitensis bv. 1 str. 16M]AVM32884.1 hypothetical protein CUC12_13505 [Brucella melitensis]ENQ68314.1 hypothetical protein C962_02350 [Brucella melitensis CNGB 1076]ENQ71346.1 hypothetical protein C963_02353 [Brucella melitensis CNGB 1120]ENQ74222.1 hypothetical protein C964_02349 [Brucella melitensis CNGB 290]ENQ77607.1 hypothetical protein C057_02825 [Brucella melitensis F10/05-2]ENQ84028.1 hypothetical protein C056_02790 [Brucella melitensis F3/0
MKRLLKVSAALLCGTMVCGAVYAASGVSGANVDTRNIFQDKRPVITANSVTPAPMTRMAITPMTLTPKSSICFCHGRMSI